MVGAAGQPLKVFGFNNGVAQPLLHAVREHVLEFGNARFQQPDLADGLGPFREQGQAGVEAMDALFSRRRRRQIRRGNEGGFAFAHSRRGSGRFAGLRISRARGRMAMGLARTILLAGRMAFALAVTFALALVARLA